MIESTERRIRINPTGKKVPREVREDIALICIHTIINRAEKEV